MSLGIFLLEHPEEAMLAGFRIALRFLGALHGAVENGHELRAPAERIHGAALDQRLQHPLVQQAQVNVFTELVDRFELPKFLTRCHDRLNGIAADVLHRRQPKADRFSMRREVRVGNIDVGRFHRKFPSRGIR